MFFVEGIIIAIAVYIHCFSDEFEAETKERVKQISFGLVVIVVIIYIVAGICGKK